MDLIDIFILLPFIVLFIVGLLTSDKDWFAGLSSVGALITIALFLIMGVANMAYFDWNKAIVTNTIYIKDCKQIELPNGNIELWRDKEKVYTISTLSDKAKLEDTEKIETRTQIQIGLNNSETRWLKKEK